MKRVILLLCMSCLLVVACASTQLMRFNEEAYLSNVIENYDRQIEDAFESLYGGNYELASKQFASALDMTRDEVPNYEAWIPLAAASCLEGNREFGLARQADASCALKVEMGELECPLMEQRGEFLREGGTEDCYKAMCGEAYTDYYKALSEAQRLRVSALQQDLDRSRPLCQAGTAEN